MKIEKKSIPKYKLIIKDILEKINSGEFSEGDRILSETEFMKLYNVSRIVVVNALSRMAREGIITRIPGKGSFVSKPSGDSKLITSVATNATQNKKRNIALILPCIIDNYSITLVQSVIDNANVNNIICSIYYSNNDIDVETYLLNFLLNTNIDGIILFPANQENYNKELINLSNMGFPLVLVDRDLPGLGLSCVQTDNRSATKNATSYLVSLGHRRIAICSQTQMPTNSISSRIDGYLSEMIENNIIVDPSLILTDLTNQENLNRLDNVIKNKAATAFICLTLFDFILVNDLICENGFKCPEDFSIVNIDKPNSFNQHSDNNTYIYQDSQKIASEAVAILVDMINGTSVGMKKILVPSVLVYGNSARKIDEPLN